MIIGEFLKSCLKATFIFCVTFAKVAGLGAPGFVHLQCYGNEQGSSRAQPYGSAEQAQRKATVCRKHKEKQDHHKQQVFIFVSHIFDWHVSKGLERHPMPPFSLLACL